jgi:hypothetical protein
MPRQPVCALYETRTPAWVSSTSVSFTTELDFRNVTEDDCIVFYVQLSFSDLAQPCRFELMATPGALT